MAEVQGIDVSEIREFVDTLTPVVLLSDTRVTNHGFRNGRANRIQSVLQAGTAVLIDESGLPRVRCACGNPLNRPIAQASAPAYSGPTWDTFDEAAIQVISPGPGTSNFVLHDVEGGEPFVRPSGTTGDADDLAPIEALEAVLFGDLNQFGLGRPRSPNQWVERWFPELPSSSPMSRPRLRQQPRRPRPRSSSRS